MPAVATLSFSDRPDILQFPSLLRNNVYRGFFPTFRPYIEKGRYFVKDSGGCLIFWTPILILFRVPPLVRVTTIYSNGIEDIVSGHYALALRGFMRLRVNLYMGKISWGLKGGYARRKFSVGFCIVFLRMSNGVSRKNFQFDMRFGRRPGVINNCKINGRFLYTSALCRDELWLVAM